MQPHRQMTCSGFSFFVWGQGAQVAEHPVLRVLPDCAGVQDHQIRLPGVLGEGEAARGQHPHEPLAVGHVLLAAEGIHAGRGVGLPGGEHGADPLLKLPLAVQIRLGNTRSSVKAVPPNSDTLTKVSYHTREKSTRKNRPGGRPGRQKTRADMPLPVLCLYLFIRSTMRENRLGSTLSSTTTLTRLPTRLISPSRERASSITVSVLSHTS